MVALSFCSSASAAAASTSSLAVDSLTTCAAFATSESARLNARSSSLRSPSGSALAALMTAIVCLAADLSASSFIPAGVGVRAGARVVLASFKLASFARFPPPSSAPKIRPTRSRSAAAAANSFSISDRSVRIPAISRSLSLKTWRKASSSSSYASVESSVEASGSRLEPVRPPSPLAPSPLALDGAGHLLRDAYRPLMSSDPPTSGAAVVDATNPVAAPPFTASSPSSSSSSAAAVSESSRGWYLTRSRTSFAVGTSSGGSTSTGACVSPLSPLSPLPASPLSAAFCLYPLTTAPGTLDTPPKPSRRTVLYP
mmetsp:Transcript_9034/g.35317  ORF Transcript_9034/g.35317 Transcript_9034/m.35317 type:complete len:313 (+) Transcript_9034:522-1460(+)